MKVHELIDILSELDPDIELGVQDFETSCFYLIKEVEVSKVGDDEEAEAFIIIQEEEYSE